MRRKMGALRCLVVLGLFAAVGAASVTVTVTAPPSLCSAKMVENCLATYNNITTSFGYNQVNGASIEDSCRSFKDAVYCVEFKAMCPDDDLITVQKWLSIKNSIGYRCTTGRSDYLHVQPCISNSTYVNAVTSMCGATNPASLINRPDVVCKDYTDHLACNEMVARAYCGDAAAQFIRKIFGPTVVGPALTISAPGCTGLCNATAIDACLMSFGYYLAPLMDLRLNTVDIDNACKAYNDTKTCVASHANCSDADPISLIRWQGVQNSVVYACSSAGRQVYLKFQACISSPSSQAARTNCSGAVPAGPTADAMCAAVNGQIACMYTSTKKMCSEEAANFVSMFQKTLFAPSAKALYPNCSITGLSGGVTILINFYLLIASIALAFLA